MKTLLEHRQEIAANPAAYTQDLPRVVNTLAKHLKDAGYIRITPTVGVNERQEFVELIFKAQGRHPFLYIGAKLPYCWNSPYRNGWNHNYIRYEWGHLNSINQNRAAAHNIENLCLMSARCNQHIQSSMNIDELLVYGGELKRVINSNLEARRVLFSSEKWKSLLDKLENFK